MDEEKLYLKNSQIDVTEMKQNHLETLGMRNKVIEIN